MASVRNISTGPRGAYRDGELIMADPGEVIEVDDFAPDWFEQLSDLTINKADLGDTDIAAAVSMLDPAADDHWTAAGLPSVDAVSEIVGRKVTRAEITAAANGVVRSE